MGEKREAYVLGVTNQCKIVDSANNFTYLASEHLEWDMYWAITVFYNVNGVHKTNNHNGGGVRKNWGGGKMRERVQVRRSLEERT